MAAQRQEGADTRHGPRVQPTMYKRSQQQAQPSSTPWPQWRTWVRGHRGLYLSSGVIIALRFCDETRVLF
jgi:hypothetical protein